MDQSLLERMRSDWNDRASEDAYYYAAFSRRKQEDSEFFQTAGEVVAWLEDEMRRLETAPETRRALEVGCGPGRLMRPLSAHFAEIQGVDVSDRMIQIAERNLAEIPHAHVQATSGADLSPFADECFDFVYSYAVFQHIPSCEVVMQYLREARRVLKTNGILTCQINGLRQPGALGSTWDGVRIPADTLVSLARKLDCQVLALDRPASQYMWTTWRKRPPGWRETSANPAGSASIRNVRSAHSGNAQIPAGRTAEFKLAMEGLSLDCDITELSAFVQGQPASVRVISHPRDGLSDVTIVAPPLSEAREARIDLLWRAQPLCAPGAIEVVSPRQNGPALVSLTDGVNYLSGHRIISRFVKIILDDVTAPDQLRASINRKPVKCSTPACVDLEKARYEVNVFLPRTVGPGCHYIDLVHASLPLPPLRIDVGMLQSTDAFPGLPAGEHVMELGNHELCTVVTILNGVGRVRSESLTANAASLPFSPGQFAGVLFRCNPDQKNWNELTSELRRVLKEDGALYVEISGLGGIQPDQFTKEIEAHSGLAYRWSRSLARSLAPHRSLAATRARSLTRWMRALVSLGLRAADRWFGTRLARGGMGFYFGRVWDQPDLRARLNGCVRCGTVHSSDQLSAAGPLVSRYPLVLYLCPSCGEPNILTVDR